MHAAEDSARDKSRKRSRSRDRKTVSLQPASKTVSLRSASKTVELRPAEDKPKIKKRARSRGDIIDYIDSKYVRQRRWKIEFNVRRHISGAEINLLFQEEESQQRVGDHRVFIGPGADGSCDDRIAVDLKYNNASDKVTVSPQFYDYVKTTFVQYKGADWMLHSSDIPVAEVNDMCLKGRRPVRSAIFIQPHADEGISTVYLSIGE